MKRSIARAIVFGVLSLGRIAAADWCMYAHDAQRTNSSNSRIALPLRCAWTFHSNRAPRPAWPSPAQQDFFHHHYNLRSTVDYDQAFHVVGDRDTLYFGSSADDKVYALDASTGRIRWTFFTQGPIRFAPVVVGDRLYVGSDDGCVYCLDAANGSLMWKRMLASERRVIPGNGRLISTQPVRTGLVVDDETVYCTAGLFPMQGAWLYALDAADGAVEWKRKLDISPQGYILLSEDRLYMPTGRTSPAIFNRADGGYLGTLSSAGGAYALLTDDTLITGPGRGVKQLHANNVRTKDRFATFGGLRVIVHDSIAYMQSEAQLSAFDRGTYFALAKDESELRRKQDNLDRKLKSNPKDKADLLKQLQDVKIRIRQVEGRRSDCYLWKVPCAHRRAMILAHDKLLVGGDGSVAAIDARTGTRMWTAGVEGRAMGLSIINGSLVVSTDTGHIHVFTEQTGEASNDIHPSRMDNPYPRDDLTPFYTEAADFIADQLDVDKGYCLVIDSREGRLAYEIVKRTDMQVIAVETHSENVATARRMLDKAGLYGRVVVHQYSTEDLPYTRHFANLIVSEESLRTGRTPVNTNRMLDLLRPCGGLLAIGRRVPSKRSHGPPIRHGTSAQWTQTETRDLIWDIARRPAMPGSGEWTHLYAEPGNSGCSNDSLVRGPMRLQWFGRPGPQRMIDRHHRNVPPLYKDGRLFIPGDCVVYAVDAYNGTIIWQTDVPDSRRLGVFLDCGNMAVDETSLYVAIKDRCHAFDPATGRLRRRYSMPQTDPDARHYWGYVASLDDTLIASATRPGASYTETSYEADNALWYRNMQLVTSDYLFAVHKETAAHMWQYEEGLILNTTISVGANSIYFVETTCPQALTNTSGRMPVRELFGGGKQHIVALDRRTGDETYRREIDTADFEEPIYLNCSNGVLLVSGSRLAANCVRYSYKAFDADSGDCLWNGSHDTGLATDGGHGEYNRHPTIIGDTVYAWPYAYDLKTGERLPEWKMDRRGHGCGGVSAGAQCLFWRGGNPWMYDLGQGGGPMQLNSVTRPGCWINMIPAGGLLLQPEASSGCTCGFSLQTSLAYVPVHLLQ